MAWFKDRLYVGTMRGNFPLMKARMPIGLDPWPVECPENPFDLDLGAEIWCYSPQDDTWERVHKSPTITGSHGKPIPREISFRCMLVYQGAAGRMHRRSTSAPGPRPRGRDRCCCGSEDGRKFKPSLRAGLDRAAGDNDTLARPVQRTALYHAGRFPRRKPECIRSFRHLRKQGPGPWPVGTRQRFRIRRSRQ